MNEKALDDPALMALIAQKNEQALSVLYDRYHRLVMTIAFHTVEDWDTAEEITLDIFTTVWEKAHTYQEERAGVRTWLTRITRNRAIDLLRQQHSQTRHDNGQFVEGLNKSDSENPELAAELAMLKQRMRSAIATLPEPQKEALLLVYFRGYSHSQAAHLLNEPLGTIKTRIRTAMQKLRYLVTEENISVSEKSDS